MKGFSIIKRDKIFIVFIILSLISGVFLHFVYNLSGENWLIGYIGTVNESIWEHTKLTVYPTATFLLIYMFRYNERLNNPFFAYGISLLVALVTVPILYILYINIFGTHSFIFDIIIFIIAIILAFITFRSLTYINQLPVSFEVLGIFIAVLIFILEIYFTYHPLDYWLFR